MTDCNRIGGKITTIREALGLSREQLAERCDCSETVIAALEQGELAPSLTPLIKITRTLGVRLGTLLDDDTMLGPVVTRSGENNGISRVKSLEIASNAGALDFFSSLTNGCPSRTYLTITYTVTLRCRQYFAEYQRCS